MLGRFSVKVIVAAFLAVLVLLVSQHFTLEDNYENFYMTAAEAGEYENILYLLNERNLLQYNLETETADILIENTEAWSLIVSWPYIWLQSEHLIQRYNLRSSDLETFYETSAAMGELFLLTNKYLIFSAIDESASRSIMIIDLSASSSAAAVLTDAPIILNGYAAVLDNALIYTPTYHSDGIYQLDLDTGESTRIYSGNCYGLAVVDDLLYYSTQVQEDGPVQTFCGIEDPVNLSDSFSGVSLTAAVKGRLYLRIFEGRQPWIAIWQDGSLQTVFELDQPPVESVCYTESGILIWSYKDLLDSKNTEPLHYYFYFYDLNSGQFYDLTDIQSDEKLHTLGL